MKHRTKFITRRSIVKMIGPVLAITLVLTLVSSVFAASDPSYDMRWPGSDVIIQETINGALWESLPLTLPTGSGVWHAFFRVADSPNERGYNTDGRPLQFDELKSKTFTHSALLAAVPLIEYPADSDDWYYEFQLDINEASSAPYISLDDFEVYTTNDEELLGYPFEDGTGGKGSGEAKLVYDLEGDGPTYIMMDYRWNTGSGKRDYRVLIPQDNFDGKDLEYVVIYTEHGYAGVGPPDLTCEDGFEEWGVAVYPTVPDTMVTIATSAVDDIVIAGQSVNLTVTEINTGTANLNNVHVYLTYDAAPQVTLNETTAIESMTNDNILEVGETWTWNATTNPGPANSLHDIVVNAQTTFTVNGYGEYLVWVPKHGHVDAHWEVAYVDYDHGNTYERAEITIYTISPDICVEKTVDCNDDGIYLDEDMGYAGDLAHWRIVVTNCGDSELTNVLTSDTNGESYGPTILASGANVTYEYDMVVSVNTTNNVTVTATDLLGGTVSDWDIATNNVITPHTTLTVVSYVYDTVSGNVEITITDCNDGDAPLTDAVVHLRANYVEYAFSAMNRTSPYFTGGDDNPNPGDTAGVLDPYECWTWVVNVTISVDTFFEAWGDGIDPLGNHVTYDPDTGEGMVSEYKSFEIEVGEATRTWGFWKTHLWLVEYMLGGSTLLDPSDPYYTALPIVTLPIDLGTWNGEAMSVNGTCRYMALMWAKQASNSDGGKREKIDAARIHTAHQALAAIMNSYMPGGASLPAGITLASIAATLSSNNITAIRDLGSVLAGYNESGDDVALDPSLPPTGRVYDDNIGDPQGGRLAGAACEPFWNTPPAPKGKNK